MTTQVRTTRRVLLVGGVAVGLAACTDTGTTDPPRAAGSGAGTSTAAQEAAIFDLSFTTTEQFRPFELVAPGFVATEAARRDAAALERADGGPAAPWAAVELRVRAGDGGSAVAGLATAGGDQVLVRWSAASGTVSLQVRLEGRSRVLRRRRVAAAATGELGLAFALCENQVTALVDTGDGWQPVLTERDKVASLVDLRREDVLGEYRYAWGGRDADLDVRAGLFGMAGLRDPHLVQNADGTPYLRAGRLHLTWTCAGLGFFQQAHWTVWSLDPADPADLRLEAQLFSRRDGLVLGDHAGQLVRDGEQWLVATSSWGDFEPGSIHVRHTTTEADLLRGVHVLDTEPTPLPTEHGSWDPGLIRVDDAWHVAFVESPSQDPFDFHPALARTTSRDWSEGLEPVAAATDRHQCEGPVLATVGDRTWLLASDADERAYPVFDLDGRPAGRLDAPYPTNIPHPQLVPAADGGWWLVTFDGTQYAEDVVGYGGHGDVVVMHAAGTSVPAGNGAGAPAPEED
ncbi:hypothetical protein [Nocardioides pantholopis]|uniref:hypothetical protein n=1 Tax=Nocardioides pantholopis TaxID=2483798 RepID=UPI000FD7D5ED|nr:hypothetical protein [Nocardioides pantholopis]